MTRALQTHTLAWVQYSGKEGTIVGQEVYQNVEEMLEVEDAGVLISARLRLADGFLEIGESERAREHAMSVHDLSLELNEHQLHTIEGNSWKILCEDERL